MHKVGSLLLCLVLGCGGTVTAPTAPASTPQPPGNPAPSNPAQPPSGNCGGQQIPIVLKQAAVPDLHLVVDRSGSMFAPVNLLQFFLTKWEVMRKTLSTLVDAFDNKIRFGLTLFPSDNQCGAGLTTVQLSGGSGAAIKGALNVPKSDGFTPTHTTLDGVRAYLAGVPRGEGERYVLLATDGIPNCRDAPKSDSGAETLTAVNMLVAQGLKVFVLGFGDIITANPALLQQLALAGGVPNTKGPHAFYPASNEAELKTALFEIAGGIVPPPCTYQLNSMPPDLDRVTVSFDGTAIPRTKSNANGWNYGVPGEIKFFGKACEMLRAGQVKRVDFAFGCQGPVVQ